ncbi:MULTISPECIES: rod shape-determining protein MreD [Thiomicrorhabdus]|uniref:Rod shape-determining protein MreD n=1 Tax=Thiomicrorhabdus heinhorstiae TaxID=2748010 RepID=A0ABS0BVQ3_9GAMM|nr:MULTISPECIES: rod shape-determining protein MreD [Thiomicrorhabdus]MBF6057155.1 rod shape-determining protein MreD [Thiomicrorhabdus heinhorstiae]
MTSKFIYIRTAQIRGLILLTFFLALIADSMNLYGETLLFLPPFTLLILLYWSGHFLDRTYITSAFILGLMCDGLYQTTLGSHALIYVSLTFMMLRQRGRFKGYTALQQGFFISFYLLVYQVISFIFFSPVLNQNDAISYWLMPLSAIIIWPILAFLLRQGTFQATESSE